MIDTTAIAGEVYDLIAANVAGIKSLEYGRIRELTTSAQMPAVDIACGSATSQQFAGYCTWRAPITIVVRTQSTKRRAATNTARAFANTIVDVLQSQKGITYYDVLREFVVSTSDEEQAGNGATNHIAVVMCTAIKDV